MQESTQKLYDAIVEAIGPKALPTAKQRALIARVKADYYHDFRGVPALTTLQLIADLQAVRLGQLVDRVKSGEFDAGQREAEEWAASPEGQAIFRDMGAVE